MKPDGSVIIDTQVMTDGAEKGFEQLKNKMSSIGKTAAKVGLAISAAFAAAAIAITKQSVSAYADYEQLVGGVETLFKDSADKVLAYAENAFYTVGLSANEYMETVTSFSASLISSLGGDTEVAADVANMALVDMADNANKMGSTMESIQSAYQGFAKQNYTMLDNLKLGYGGTKTEMERLLKDAEALTGQKYDISNLADVYNAIHAIQENLGIAGTTAEEAEETITGSANMMKAAWQNVLAAISGGGDIDKAINNLVYSVTKYFDNIVPVIQRAISGVGTLIKKIAPQLVQTVATELIKALPSLLEAVYQMIVGLAKGIYQGIVALIRGETTEASAQLNDVAEAASSATETTEELEEATKSYGKALAGFDELNILNNSDTEDESDTVTTSSVTVSSVSAETNETEEAATGLASAISEIFQELQKKIADYASLFEPTFSAWRKAFKQVSAATKKTTKKIGGTVSTLRDETLAPLGDYILTDFVPSIVNTFSENLAPVFSDIMANAVEGFEIDFDNMALAIGESCSQVQTALEGIEIAFGDMCISINENWDEYGGSILEGVLEFKEGLWETIWDIYNGIIKPVFERAAEIFAWLWDNHLKPLWDNIVEFVLSLVDNILQLWNGFLKPLIDWLVVVLGPIVKTVLTGIVEALAIAFGVIADVVGAILKILDGVITFIVGVFTLDFKKAWEGIKKIFTGVVNGIIAVLEGCVNGIIWAINQFISLLTSAIKGIVNGLGSVVKAVGNVFGKDWGFSISPDALSLGYISIPRLAQGAVIPANKEFLAVLGDQKHGTNIEAPLSTIQEAVRTELTDMVGGMMAGFEALLAENQRLRAVVESIDVGDTTIGQAASRYNQRMAIIEGV